PASRRDDGRDDSVDPLALRQGPGGRVIGADYRLYRLRGLLYFPGTGDAVPGVRAAASRRALADWVLSAASNNARRCANTSPKWLDASAGGSRSHASASPASATISIPCLRARCIMARFSARQCMKREPTPQFRARM